MTLEFENAFPRPSKPSRWFFILAFEGGLALIAVALYAVGWLRPEGGLQLIWQPPYWTSWVWGLVGCLPMLFVLWAFMKLDLAWLSDLRRFVSAHIRPFFADFQWWELAIICFWVGFCEELLFRWSLQFGLDARFPDAAPWLGLMVASIAFGLCHAVTIAYALITVLIGLYLGLLMMVAGDLMAPAVAHGVYDLIALLVIQQMPTPEARRTMPTGCDHKIDDGGSQNAGLLE